MKVNIIKGPQFELNKKKAQEFIYYTITLGANKLEKRAKKHYETTIR
ncbi:hypothetical protein M3598_01175 [Cytobacillus oceanisediminis]|nr:hypothetical protein [Cytobacillus oceanisediminis]MCM3241342.1 hypothetical protein [Cytobacillus oceanisediminis]